MLPEYRYKDLHAAFSEAIFWDGEESEVITYTCINDAIEYYIDSLHPTSIEDIGEIQITGYNWDLECAEEESQYLLKKVCIVKVDALEWAKENIPDWLEEETND